jgi:hypothetical protein
MRKSGEAGREHREIPPPDRGAPRNARAPKLGYTQEALRQTPHHAGNEQQECVDGRIPGPSGEMRKEPCCVHEFETPPPQVRQKQPKDEAKRMEEGEGEWGPKVSIWKVQVGGYGGHIPGDAPSPQRHKLRPPRGSGGQQDGLKSGW